MDTVVVQSGEPTQEAVSAELAAAAAKAPVTTEEALAAVKSEGTPQVATRPDNVPEKFWNAEKGEINTSALLASYTELEKTRSAPAEKQEGAAEENPKADEKKPEGEQPKEAPKPAEVVSNLSKVYQEKGEFSDADYVMAESAGFDRATVDAYVAGQKALAEAATRQITDAAGGKENMDRLFAWASTSLTEAEITDYNKSFEGGDVNAAVLAMGKLKTAYEAVHGKDPSRRVEGAPAGGAVDTFGSWAEVTLAMQDPAYDKDPSYRAKVQAKLARSNPR